MCRVPGFTIPKHGWNLSNRRFRSSITVSSIAGAHPDLIQQYAGFSSVDNPDNGKRPRLRSGPDCRRSCLHTACRHTVLWRQPAVPERRRQTAEGAVSSPDESGSGRHRSPPLPSRCTAPSRKSRTVRRCRKACPPPARQPFFQRHPGRGRACQNRCNRHPG